MKTVLITGASSGIGLEFSHIFAKNYYRVILVARDKDKLRALQKELHEKYGVEVVIVPKDLALTSAAEQVYTALKQANIEVDILVNNAGFGAYGKFSDIEPQRELEMINVNITSLTLLTKIFLKDMIERKHGKILNVASTASFVPGPMMTVYYATKAYVLSFSEALAEELSGTGITVTTLCPGPTQSGFQKAANIEDSRLFKNKKIPTSKEVAEYGYDALMKGRRVAIHGTANKMMIQAIKFAPRKIITKIVKDMNEQ